MEIGSDLFYIYKIKLLHRSYPEIINNRRAPVMHVLFPLSLLLCSCAGIIAEIITISAPEKVIGIIDNDPADIARNRFYRALFILSAVYMLLVILLFFSGNYRFRIYGAVIVAISISGWVFRSSFKKHTFIVIAESTISLILLFDIIRTVIGDLLPALK